MLNNHCTKNIIMNFSTNNQRITYRNLFSSTDVSVNRRSTVIYIINSKMKTIELKRSLNILEKRFRYRDELWKGFRSVSSSTRFSRR